MSYQVEKFDYLLGTPGLSDDLLNNHFALYEGYVANANKLAEKLESMAKEGTTDTPEYAELKRRFGWEWNGMRLHELYFENLTPEKKELSEDADFSKQVEENFGSLENWEKDFKATGAMRGIGWVVLYYDREDGRLFNCWIDEHDRGHLSGAAPILVMDVFEHAHYIDYGKDRGSYIAAFWQAVNWEKVADNFDKVLAG